MTHYVSIAKQAKAALKAKDKRIKELEAALRAINIYSRNTPGGTSSELGRIARKALQGE